MAQQIYVWDKFVRVFHWSLVGLFATSYLTGENEHWLHSYSGYAIVSLIAMRLIWGFIGSRHARFSDFVRNPLTISKYMVSIVQGNPARFLGHNPAGGAMVVLLLITLSTITFSGMKLLAIEEGEGPFASNIRVSLITPAYADTKGNEHANYEDDEYKHEAYEHKYEDEEYEDSYEREQHETEDYEHENEQYEERKEHEQAAYQLKQKYQPSQSDGHDQHEAEEEFWEDIHEASISFMLLLIVLHVVGVIVASRQHNESLVKAMITGSKNDNP